MEKTNIASGLYLRPVSFKQARDFIKEMHRHNKPPTGHKFSIGVVDAHNILRGVASAGRPIARAFDDGLTLEINRTCTDGFFNANSMLYGAVWRAAKAMGYSRCLTYTQQDETGASLRAVGWTQVRSLSPRKSWRDSTGDERRKAKRDPIGNGGVARTLWEIRSERNANAPVGPIQTMTGIVTSDLSNDEAWQQLIEDIIGTPSKARSTNR